MSSSSVTCDGSGVYAQITAPVSKVWDTGLHIFVPENYFCWFLPKNTHKWKQVLLRPSEHEQPLHLQSKFKFPRVTKGKLIGTLHFLKSIEEEKSVKLEWKEE